MKNRKFYENGGLEIKEAKLGAVLLCLGAVMTFVFALISVRLLVMPLTHADTEAVIQTSFTVSSSCSMSSDTDTAHESDIAPGVYKSEIGETTITTVCNDANGYAVYAAGFTNNELGRNDMLGQSSGRTIATGTATSGGTSNWAMRLTPVDNTVAPTIATGYEDYHTVPGEYTKVVSFANNTTTNDAGSKFKITFAGFVSSTQAADTYNGKVKYVLVHPANSTETPCVGTYTINYDSNGGFGNMDSQTVCVDRATVVLANGFTPPVPVAENQFATWNTAADGSGYKYYTGQSVTNLASAGGTVTLYAQWASKYIQDMTASMCQTVASENPYTVYDRRDGNDYTIRYIEGACWMTQNLRITGTVNKQYSNFSTYDNVDVCEEDWTVSNSYFIPYCHDSGNTTNGVWYNYAAASAKTIVGDSNTTEATEDICPAGWRLPSHGDAVAGSIDSLSSTSETLIRKFSPVAGGDYYDGSSHNTGNGFWWSTSAQNTTLRRRLVYNGRLSGDGYYRYSGAYIRCVRL
ncbi:InlB B-repeat-containing protein [Candidatus Saccharibacteria bacterium]|nr:InlB B-repeat-containing protein [Candidatus Saccharibacteria bacterium]